jgi:hypothetical protein
MVVSGGLRGNLVVCNSCKAYWEKEGKSDFGQDELREIYNLSHDLAMFLSKKS